MKRYKVSVTENDITTLACLLTQVLDLKIMENIKDHSKVRLDLPIEKKFTKKRKKRVVK